MNMPRQLSEFQNYLETKNKIWIVGSGSLDAFPRPGCNCFLCQIARKGGKDRRLPASSIFYKGVLFDVGKGVWERLCNKEVRPQAIVLSHAHFDHIADLMEYPRISKTIPVYASVHYYPLFKKLGIRTKFFKPGSSIKPVKNLTIETKIGVHTFTRPVCILKFDKMIYAPDLGDVRPEDMAFAKGTKLWFGDGFCFDEDFVLQGERLHQAAKDLLLELRELKSLESVVLLGIGHHSKWPHEDYELLLKKFAFDHKLPFMVELGFDNQVIRPPK